MACEISSLESSTPVLLLCFRAVSNLGPALALSPRRHGKSDKDQPSGAGAAGEVEAMRSHTVRRAAPVLDPALSFDELAAKAGHDERLQAFCDILLAAASEDEILRAAV